MNVAVNVLTVIYALVCLVIIIVVLLQSGKQAGMSGSIAGGAENLFGKTKAKSIDGMLEKWTSYIAIAFLLLSIVIALLTTLAK